MAVVTVYSPDSGMVISTTPSKSRGALASALVHRSSTLWRSRHEGRDRSMTLRRPLGPVTSDPTVLLTRWRIGVRGGGVLDSSVWIASSILRSVSVFCRDMRLLRR